MKMKLNKYILLILASFIFVVSSCNNLINDSDSDDDKSSVINNSSQEKPADLSAYEGKTAYLSVSLDELSANTSSRTVLPDFTQSGYAYNGFTKFVLKGAKSGSTQAVIKSWETTTAESTTTTAYSKLTDSEKVIPIKLSAANTDEESWDFTLTAYHHGGDVGTVTTFEGTTTVTVRAGEATVADSGNNVSENNMLNFTLYRNTKYQFDTSKSGSIELTLSYVTGAVTTAKLYSYSDENKTAITTDSFTGASGSSKVFAVSGIAEGIYVAEFSFTNNDVEIGSMKEYIYVFEGLTSKKTLNVDVNANYTISYYYEILDTDSETEPVCVATTDTNVSATSIFASDYTPTMYYSRLTTVELPKPENFVPDYCNDKYLFCGWYEDADLTKGPVLKIPRNTAIGDKDYYAKFIDARENQNIASVKITPDSEFKVGHKLTATAYTDANSSTAFAGTILEWKWYVQGTESDTEFTTGVSSLDPVSGSLATTSSYIVRPLHYQKTLKAEALQKYKVARYTSEDAGYTENTADATHNNYVSSTGADLATAGIYKVLVNTLEVDNSYSAGNPVTATKSEPAEEIGAGTLTVTPDFKLDYSYGTGENVVIGSALSSDNIIDTENVLAQVYDSKAGETWNLSALTGTGNDFTPSDVDAPNVVFTAQSPVAPATSNYVDSKLTAYGYEDLPLTGDNQVFVKVRYPNPDGSSILASFWKLGDADATVNEGFDYGYISLKSLVYTQDSIIGIPLLYKYASDTSDTSYTTPTAVRALTGGTYNLGDPTVVTTTTEGETTSTVIPCDINVNTNHILVFKAGQNDSGKTTATNPKNADEGVIYGSAGSVSLTFSNVTGSITNDAYIGTRVSITGLNVTMAENAGGTFAEAPSYPVGYTLKVEPVYNVSGTTYSDIKWTFVGSQSSIQETGVSATYVIKQADYSVNENHTMVITASKLYAWQSEEKAVPVTITIAKGTMAPTSGFTNSISYKGDPLTIGATADVTKLTYVGSTEADGRIAYTGSETDGVNDAVSTTTAVTGYKVEFVDNAVVEKVAGADTGRIRIKITATGYNDFGTEEPYYVNGIKLKETAPVASKVSLSSDKTNISYGCIKFVLADSNYSGEFKYYQLEYSLDNGSHWNAVPVDEFVIPNQMPNSFIVRTKQQGYVTNTPSTLAYYDAGTSAWWTVSDSVVTTTEVDSGSITPTYVASAETPVEYNADVNDGTRGIPANAITVTFQSWTDAQLETPDKNGNVITITLKSGFTASRWKIDAQSISSFCTAQEIASSCITTGTNESSQSYMTIDVSTLKSGTYPVTVVCTNTETGMTYNASVSFGVSK